MTETVFYDVHLNHEDIRRELENYMNQAKALGMSTGSGYGDFPAYVQLISVIAQIETNNQRKWKVEE